jgi:hypothetical protein
LPKAAKLPESLRWRLENRQATEYKENTPKNGQSQRKSLLSSFFIPPAYNIENFFTFFSPFTAKPLEIGGICKICAAMAQKNLQLLFRLKKCILIGWHEFCQIKKRGLLWKSFLAKSKKML